MTKTFSKLLLPIVGVLILFSCSDNNDVVQLTPKETIENNSPWITTAIYEVVNGTVDKSTNYISDATISANTISSAQYKDGKFIFVPVNYTTGDFATPITESLTSNFGKFELLQKTDGLYRRVFETNFNYTHERKIVTLNNIEFTYEYVVNGKTYHVEHLKYSNKFPNKTYPAALSLLVTQRLASIQ